VSTAVKSASQETTALQQENANSNSALLASALKQGSKPWKRSKFSLLGQGRAGKTAFANAIAGRQFEDTASTVGINQLTCDVKHIQAGAAGGSAVGEQTWGECTKNAREFEAALAEIMARAKKGMPGVASGDIRAYMQGITSRAGVDDDDEDEDQGAVGGEGLFTVSDEDGEADGAASGGENQQWAAVQQVGPVAGGEGVVEHPAVDGERKAAARRKGGKPAPADNAPLDEEMVMKMLATMQDADSGLLISLFDFGGQSVFEVIHHLFLTRNGVYALVFNMEWLLSDGPDKERALRFMRNWLSSIAVHTFNKTTQMTAPIVIVGTRLDSVTSPAAHEKISTILHEHFSDNLAWRSVVGNEEGRDSNGRAFQWFFPVDNTLGHKGPAMKHLMSVVQGTIDKAEYTHKEVPLTWFKTIDQMADTQKDCLSLQEVATTAQRCDVSEQEVPLLLSFLHDMGHLMWLDEPGLRDVVILDPVSYLVVPATIIICKLSPDHEDTTHHFMTSHRECERMHKREWMLLKHSGVLNVKLLPILWESYVAHTEALLMLMVKFGLLVPLRSEGEGPVTQYLVPTLLSPAPLSDPNVANWADGPYSSCYFVFTLAEELGQSSTVTEAELKSAGFLPGGMFERIVGKALSWSQDTARGCSIDLQRVMLHKDMAVLAFGRQRFRLVQCADIHCVRLDVEGANPVGIQQKLFDFIKRIIDECMKSLLCFPAVSFHSEVTENATAPPGLMKCLLPSELLIPLQQLRKAGKGQSMLAWRGGRTLITLPEIKSKYGQWLQLFERRERYDAFISYRWGRYDSEFTEQLFDMFTNFSVGAQSRAVEVFLDRKRLQEGRLFKSDFAAALTHSLVVVPVVSLDALGRMFEHAPGTVDNVLLEWIMILESFWVGRVQKVFPVLFGKRESVVSDAQGVVVTVADLFSDGSLNALPTTAPTATLTQAAELLSSNGIEPSEKMRSYTVHSVVHELLGFLLCKASDFASNRLVESFAGKVVTLLEDCGDLSAAQSSAPAVHAMLPAVQAAPFASHDPPVPAVSPAPAATAKAAPQRTGLALKDLTAEEVGELLERSGYKKVRPVFLANEVTGKHLFLCEEFADLMTEDFGVVSKPVAKLLMESIEGWRRDGVSL
jgi:GTPase SAR1 family protein